MEHILLQPLYHRGKDCIGILFPKNKELQSLVQQKAGAIWSRTHGCWYLDLNRKNYDRLTEILEGKAIVNNRALREFLQEKKVKNTSVVPPMEHSGYHRAPASVPKIPQSPKPSPVTCEKNIEALQRFRQMLQLKSYSPSTIRTYTNEFIQFLNTLKNVAAESMTTQRLKDYLEYCHKTLKLSENTLHSRINALKFYYEQVLHSEKFFWEIPRPKKPMQLPKVISKERIAGLINSIENVKHKTIIMLAYACGLRVSEVISLKVNNIDGQRRILMIQQSKGKKDRVVSLSPNMLVMLREYYKQYRPTHYLFEGQDKNQHLTSRSIQNVLYKAKAKAGIKQEGGMHMLRHSFATHLLDKGIDVVFIQKLLGHNDIKTTLKYLHVTNKDVVQILSPIEDIEGLLKK